MWKYVWTFLGRIDDTRIVQPQTLECCLLHAVFKWTTILFIYVVQTEWSSNNEIRLVIQNDAYENIVNKEKMKN